MPLVVHYFLYPCSTSFSFRCCQWGILLGLLKSWKINFPFIFLQSSSSFCLLSSNISLTSFSFSTILNPLTISHDFISNNKYSSSSSVIPVQRLIKRGEKGKYWTRVGKRVSQRKKTIFLELFIGLEFENWQKVWGKWQKISDEGWQKTLFFHEVQKTASADAWRNSSLTWNHVKLVLDLFSGEIIGRLKQKIWQVFPKCLSN